MKIISNKRYDEFIFAEHEYKGLTEYTTILKQKNKELKEKINNAIEYIKITIEIIKQQPTGNDEWILDRLNVFLLILEGDK